MNPTDVLAWVVVAVLGGGALLEAAGRDRAARYVAATGWVAFGVFWVGVFPQFAFEMRSPIQSVLILAAIPISVHAAYLVLDGRDSVFVLGGAIAVMGLIYLPVETVPPVRQFLIETVAGQTHAVMTGLGYDPVFTEGPDYGYQNRFVFEDASGHEYSTYIVAACTGIGSMSIFGGLVAAVKAPLRRRLAAMAAAFGIIWVLNIGRNVFISVAFGHQWFQQNFLVGLVIPALYEDPHMTSFFVADRVIAEVLAVVALVGITLLVVRIVPELLAVLEEALYVCTRREVDLGGALGIDEGSDAGGEEAVTNDETSDPTEDVPPVGDADPGRTGDD